MMNKKSRVKNNNYFLIKQHGNRKRYVLAKISFKITCIIEPRISSM